MSSDPAPMPLTREMLTAACQDDAFDAGLSIRVGLQPLAGPGAPVKPATYAGGVYQLEARWRPALRGDAPVDVVVIDKAPSQANRLEAALENQVTVLGLPAIVLDVARVVSGLPAHLPGRLSSWRWPHRQADAYLRDAKPHPEGDGRDLTAVKEALERATERSATTLYEWFPQALLYGWWQSHLGTSKSQARFARAWTSEIVGYVPAAEDLTGERVRVNATKGDPYNLSIDTQVEKDPTDQSTWRHTTKPLKEKDADSKVGLSSVGHGQVVTNLSERALGWLSFRLIEQQATMSLARLRQVTVGDLNGDVDAAGRALLVALAVFAHTAAFGRPFTLRSGCDLRPLAAEWTWLGATGDDDRPIRPLTIDEAASLVAECAQAAADRGLPVGERWPEPLHVVPDPRVVEAIQKTYGLGARP